MHPKDEYIMHHANMHHNDEHLKLDYRKYSINDLIEVIDELNKIIQEQNNKHKKYLFEKLKQVATTQYNYEVEANLFGTKEYYRPKINRRTREGTR